MSAGVNPTENMSAGDPKARGRVCLIGAPNSGKTTLFNWLTGLNYKPVNYPGSTVESAEGFTSERWGETCFVTDAPGTYSLLPKSFEEGAAVDSLFQHPTHGPARLVIAVADVNQLSRHLYIVRQLIDAKFRVVLALTNIDLLRESGRDVNVEELERALGLRVALINGQSGEGVDQLMNCVQAELSQGFAPPTYERPTSWSKDKCETMFQDLLRLQQRVVVRRGAVPTSDARLKSRRIDRVLMHPVWGLLFFVIFMSLIFTSIFWAAAPLMDAVDSAFGALASWAVDSLASQPLLADFVGNAVIGGLGSVLIFLPQIFILFLGISYLEDSGYMARAASLIDRPLSKLGLNGRSFVPLLSGYACAIPAMMAARTISSKKERFLTVFIVPLMSCSARLPVYALLLSFLLVGSSAWWGGLALAFIYLGSLVVGALASGVANKILKTTDDSIFMLELPVYRRPQLRAILKQVLSKTRSYVVKAGPVIFVLSLFIWTASTFPSYQAEDPTDRLTGSYAASVGRMIEPVLEPMGVDWRVGVGLISAFAAREVFVSTLAVVFHITEENEESLQASLLQQMREATFPDGTAIFTVASVVGLILFFMIALQCVATVGVARREFGSWRWALTQLVVFNAVAYVFAVVAVQGLRLLGIS
jgi:ferrous iron transport protein B